MTAGDYLAQMRVKSLVWQQQQRDSDSDKSAGDLRAFVARRMAWRIAQEKARSGAPAWPVDGELLFDGATGTLRRIADFDDSAQIATPFPARQIRDAREFAEAEADYRETCIAETGQGATPEQVERQRKDRAEIKRQSHILAHMLETAGTEAYRSAEFQLWIWHVHSLTADAIPGFRRICFLPYVAAMVRADKLAALEWFLSCNPFCRMWTFTGGKRCGIDRVGKRVSQLNSRLNRLNKELKRRFGVELVFRSTELGTPEFTCDPAGRKITEVGEKNAGNIEFDEHGEPLFHVHAHCVVKSLVGYIKPERWNEMIDWVWSHWKDHWDAGEIIRKPRELCKYVTKPGDMLKLTPDQLKRLEAQLHGKRLVSPLGSLKREIAWHKGKGRVLRRKRTPDGLVWRWVLSHNAHAKATDAEREEVWRHHRAEKMDRHDAHAGGWDHVGALPRKRDTLYCSVLARLAPAIGPRGIKEPRVVVGGTHFDRNAITKHPLVCRLWSETVESWEDGLRRISVHTGTTIGERCEPLPFMHDVPERCAPPGEPVFAEN